MMIQGWLCSIRSRHKPEPGNRAWKRFGVGEVKREERKDPVTCMCSLMVWLQQRIKAVDLERILELSHRMDDVRERILRRFPREKTKPEKQEKDLAPAPAASLPPPAPPPPPSPASAEALLPKRE